MWAYSAIYCLKPLESLDELWIYNMGQEMAKGGMPYRDFSAIMTPFSFLLSGGFLRLFGQELLVVRILGALVFAGICFLFYAVLRQKTEDGLVPAMFTALFCIRYGSCCTYDYNWLLLLEAMALLFLQLRHREGCGGWKRQESLGVGILGGMAFLTKQSTGLCVMLVNLAVCYLDSRKREKRHFRDALAGSCASLAVCYWWMKSTGIEKEFWDYCFGGLGSFTQGNKIGIREFIQGGGILAFAELGIVGVVTILVLCRAYGKPSDRRRRLVMLGFAYAAGTIIYPIMDFVHFQVALAPFLLAGAEMLTEKCKKVSRKERITAVMILAALACTVPFLVLDEENVQWSRLKHFRGIRINADLEENVETVMAYIGGEESYIVDASAAMYHIPMDKYYKDYDMFLNGNLGSRKAVDVIEQLRGREGLILILKEEYALNWQTPVEAIRYIREHCVKMDEVEQFEVYRFMGGG